MNDNVIYVHEKPREIAQVRTGGIEFPAEAKFRNGSRQAEPNFQERSS